MVWQLTLSVLCSWGHASWFQPSYLQRLGRSLSLHFTTLTQIRSPPDSYYSVWRSTAPMGQTTFTQFASLQENMCFFKKEEEKKKASEVENWIEFIQFGSPHDASRRTSECASVPVWNEFFSQFESQTAEVQEYTTSDNIKSNWIVEQLACDIHSWISGDLESRIPCTSVLKCREIVI